MNRIVVIQKIVDALKAQKYLEIGVRYGTVFYELDIADRIGVDPDFKISWKKKIVHPIRALRARLFKMESDTFFDTVAKTITPQKFDVVFIDGLHTYEQSQKDLNNSLDRLNPHGVIVLHDCNAPTLEASRATQEEGAGPWCGDIWKTILHTRSMRRDVTAFVLDTDYGLGIVVKKASAAPSLRFTPEQIKSLKYQDFEAKRKDMIDLKPVSYLETFVSSLRS